MTCDDIRYRLQIEARLALLDARLTKVASAAGCTAARRLMTEMLAVDMAQLHDPQGAGEGGPRRLQMLDILTPPVTGTDYALLHCWARQARTVLDRIPALPPALFHTSAQEVRV